MTQDPLHLICIEPHFPGRLGLVADWLVRRRGYRCWFYCASGDSQDRWPASVGKGLDIVQFGVATESAVPWMRHLERGLCYAYSAWAVLESRRPRPVDLVLGRSAGLGSTLFVPSLYAGTPIVNLFDYFYHPRAHDLAAEARANMPPEYYNWRRSANAMDLLDLENGVTAWTRTLWQRDLYPAEYRDDFVVQYDGVQAPQSEKKGTGPLSSRGPGPLTGSRQIAGRTIPPDTRVVSFVSQALDRLRGFDRFIELANRLMRWSSNVLCVAVGGPVVQRGLDVDFFNKDYSAQVLANSPAFAPERLWMPGTMSRADVGNLLAISDLHIYPSRAYPVASSMVEALASGCVVLAWDSVPVQEFIAHGRTGLLVPCTDMDAAEDAARSVLLDPVGHQPIGQAAAELVRQRYSQEVTMPAVAALFTRLVNGGLTSQKSKVKSQN